MHVTGILIGIFSFLIIGVFHPIVIKCEYYFSARIWPIFLVVGLVLVAVSLMIPNVLLSSFFSVAAFSSFWSIGELRQQEKRVEKGWFPQNPNRKQPYKHSTVGQAEK